MSDDCKEVFLPPSDKTIYGDVVDVGEECYIKTGHATGHSTQYYPLSGFDEARRITLRNECKPRPLENFCSDRVIDPETGGPMCYDFDNPDPGARTIPGTRKILDWESTRIGSSIGSCYRPHYYHQKGSGFGSLDVGPYPSNVPANCHNTQAALASPDGTWYYHYTGKFANQCTYSFKSTTTDPDTGETYISGIGAQTQWPSSWKKTLTDGRYNVSTPWGFNCAKSLWNSWLELHFPYPVTLLPGKYVAHATRAHGRRTAGTGKALPVEDQVFGSFERIHADDIMYRNSDGSLMNLPVYYSTHFPGTHGTDNWDPTFTSTYRYQNRGATGTGYWSSSSRDAYNGNQVHYPVGHGRITDGVVPELIEGVFKMIVGIWTSGVTQFNIENMIFSNQPDGFR